MAAIFRRNSLSAADAATVAIIDWDRMGDDGRVVLRLIEGLHLIQSDFPRWYRTAHLLERPPIWSACEGDEAPDELRPETQQVHTAPNTPPLRGASADKIDTTITAVYDYAQAHNMKPPQREGNCRARDKTSGTGGLTATGTRIQILLTPRGIGQEEAAGRSESERQLSTFLGFRSVEIWHRKVGMFSVRGVTHRYGAEHHDVPAGKASCHTANVPPQPCWASEEQETLEGTASNPESALSRLPPDLAALILRPASLSGSYIIGGYRSRRPVCRGAEACKAPSRAPWSAQTRPRRHRCIRCVGRRARRSLPISSKTTRPVAAAR